MSEQLTPDLVEEILREILDDSTSWILAVATYQALLDSPQLSLVLLECPHLIPDLRRCEIMLG